MRHAEQVFYYSCDLCNKDNYNEPYKLDHDIFNTTIINKCPICDKDIYSDCDIKIKTKINTYTIRPSHIKDIISILEPVEERKG